jgi:hypothetical protein
MRPVLKHILQVVLLAGLVWGVLAALGLVVNLSPQWPAWAVAIIVALAGQLLCWLYRYESATVESRWARWLVGLRLAALAMLVWIWIEPTWVRSVSKDHRRTVVVVLDESASMQLKDSGQDSTRLEIGNKALADSRLTEKLKMNLLVRTMHVARSVQKEGETVGEDWSQVTDLAGALDTVLMDVRPDELGGVVLVSDGRHNAPTRVEEVARRFGILDAPVAIMAVGSEVPPRDAVVVSVKAPKAIHLGDKMRVDAEIKFDGYKGGQATVKLMRGAGVLETRVVSIPQDHHRETLQFIHSPKADGVSDFRVEISALEDERFSDNNGWNFETSITDALTNVLLVEGHPRWEFRYLRNLFYGRDKSVQLQFVLLHPDQITGQRDEVIVASAARPFGEARATRLPQSEKEWRQFDVIILGDIEPQAISDEQWEHISKSVNERGALLAMIAGPQFMPHAIKSETGRALVPVEVEWGPRTCFDSRGKGFRVGLTADGARHPLTQEGGGEFANDQVWADFPEFYWRHPLLGIKDGAEVLLKAVDAFAAETPRSAAGLSAELARLAERRASEAEAALLVTRNTGHGKVALLLTDRTWRLREGAGDVYHHRFWGNMIRWGAGPVLQAGGLRVRLGTDKLTYTPGEKVKIMVRMRNAELQPLTDDALQSEVLCDGKVIATLALAAGQGSNGLHLVEAGPFAEPGKYQVQVKGEKVEALIAEDGKGPLSTGFRVVGSHNPVEMTDTTLNRPLLQTIADLSGGRVVKPAAAGDLAALFDGDKYKLEEVRETSLWDRWLVIGLFACLVTAEWVMRRGRGLP